MARLNGTALTISRWSLNREAGVGGVGGGRERERERERERVKFNESMSP